MRGKPARSGGWKPTQKLAWDDGATHGPTGQDIGDMWYEKYTKIYVHDGGKFDPAWAKVSGDVQDDMKRLYLHLKRMTHKVRGGDLPKDKPCSDAAQAGYIWKTFKKQCYHLFKENQWELNKQTMIRDLKELFEELDGHQTPGTAARAKVVGIGPSKSVSKTRVASLGSRAQEDASEQESRGEGSEQEPSFDEDVQEENELLEDDQDEIAKAVADLNEDEGLGDEEIPRSLTRALKTLHTMSLDYSKDNEELEVDSAVYPEPSKSTARDSDLRPFQEVVPVGLLKAEIFALSRTRSGATPNPMAPYRPGGVDARKDLESSSRNKRKVEDRLDLNEPDKGRLTKKIKSTENVGALADSTRGTSSSVAGEVSVEALGESIQSLSLISGQCGGVWDSCQVMRGALYVGQGAQSYLREPVLNGMWQAAELCKSLDTTENPIDKSVLNTIKDLDGIGTKF